MKIITVILLIIGAFQITFAQKSQKNSLGILNGRAINLPKPEYSEEAKKFCAGGKVEVEITINKNGDVIEAKAVSGDELLWSSAVDAVKRAKFAPVEHSNAATLKGIIVYNFDSFNKCPNFGIINKKAVNLPKPTFPDYLRIKKQNISGVKIVVNESGNVIYANAISGHPIVRAMCETAARHAKFSPIFITPGPIKIPALLIYKFKIDGTIDTNIASDDKDAAVTPIKLVEPTPAWCNCRFGINPKVTVIAEIDERGNVFKATAVSGHPILRTNTEKVALESTFLPVNLKSTAIIEYYFEEVDKRSVKFLEAEVKNAKDIKINK